MMHSRPSSFQPPPKDNDLFALERSSWLWRFLQWFWACAITLGVHAGLFLIFVHETEPPPVETQPPLAAVMIDLAPIAVSAVSQVDNSQPGPPSVESEPVEEVQPEPTPPPPPPPEPVAELPPPPPEVKPEAVLPPKPPEPEVKPIEPEEKPKLEEPPKEEPPKEVPKKPPVKKKAAKPQIASKSGGGPKSDVAESDVSKGASAGGTQITNSVMENWRAKIRGRIVRAKRYPAEARQRQEEGVVRVSVTFGADGVVTAARLLQTSGSAALDREAVDVMHRASPFPAPPDGRATTLVIPLNFNRR